MLKRIVAGLLSALLLLTQAVAQNQRLYVPGAPSLGGDGLRAGITLPSILGLSSRIVFLGDSITAARGFAGYVDWAHFYSRGRFYPKVVGSNGLGPTGWDQGVVGNTTADVITRLANMSAESPKVLFLEVGTNDIATGAATAAQICANYDTIIAAGQAAGAKVMALTVIPRSSAGWSGAMETDRGTVNTCLKAKLPGAVVDADPIITNTATQLMADGTHPNGTGAQLLGAAVASLLSTVITASEILYDPANVPAENLYANSIFAGGATVATSWSFFQNTNGLTKAASKVTVDGLYNGQRYVATGTASANAADNFNQTVTPPGGLAGELYEAWVELVATKTTGITGIAISAGTNNTNSTHMSITSQDAATLTVPFRGVLRAPPSVLAADGGNFNSRISILPANGATVDADITLLRSGYRKVPSGQ